MENITILLFIFAIFVSLLSLFLKTYGHRIVFSLFGGIIWILLALEVTEYGGLYSTVFALFGGVFMLFGIVTGYNFMGMRK